MNISQKQTEALASIVEALKDGTFTGTIGFVGDRPKSDNDSQNAQFVGQEAVRSGFQVRVSGGQNTPAKFLEGASSVDPSMVHVVVPWIQGTTDNEGRDINWYREQLGLRPLNLETLQEIPPPEDEEEAARDKATREAAIIKLAEDEDTRRDLDRGHRRLLNALKDESRFEDLDEVTPYTLVGGMDANGNPIGDGQVAYAQSRGFTPVDVELVEPATASLYPRWDALGNGQQKLAMVNVFITGLPETHVDLFLFVPEPVLGGGAPNIIRRYASSLGIPCLNVRRESAASWTEFFSAIQEAVKEHGTTMVDLQAAVDAIGGDIEAEKQATTDKTPTVPVVNADTATIDALG